MKPVIVRPVQFSIVNDLLLEALFAMNAVGYKFLHVSLTGGNLIGTVNPAPSTNL